MSVVHGTSMEAWDGDASVRFRDGVAVATLILLGAAFLFEMATLQAVPVARDVQLFFVPHKHILWDALRRGEMPLWTPLIRTGYPVLANFQSGVFYPPHWLFGMLPFFVAFNGLVVFHLVLGGVGSYLLARQLDLHPVSAWVAGAGFMLGGYFVSLTNLVNALQAAAWAPLVTAAVLHHVEAWRPRSLFVLIMVCLFGFLAGEPLTFLLASCVALLVALVHAPGSLQPVDARVRAVAGLCMAGLAVAGLAAVQILPTLEMVGLSDRGEGLSVGRAGRYSLSPVRLVHLLVPNDFADPSYRFGKKLQLAGTEPWLFSVYLGTITLVAAWHARLDRRRGLVRLWTALAVVGVVLALGAHSPVYRWLHGAVPGLAAFRFPEKFFLFSGLAVPLLAAQGTEVLLRRPDVRRADAVAALLALAIGLGAKLTWALRPDVVREILKQVAPDAPALANFGFAYVEWGENLEIVLVLLVIGVSLVALYRVGRLHRRAFVGLFLVLLGADLWLAHRNLNPGVDRSFYAQPPRMERHFPEDTGRQTYRYRAMPVGESVGDMYSHPDLPAAVTKWFWQKTMHPNSAALWDILSHGSTDAIHLRHVVQTDELLRELDRRRRQRVLRLGSVKWVYRPELDRRLDVSRVVALDSVPGFLHVLEDPLPRAYLARGQPFEDEIRALNWALDPDTDYRSEVAVLPPEADAQRRSSDIGSGRVRPDSAGPRPDDDTRDESTGEAGARVVADEGERLEVRVSPDTSSFLVLTDTWYPGWDAHVDGEERPLHRANYFFRAVRVEPGDETVVLRYRSAPLRQGAWISAGSFVLLIAGLAGWTVRRRRDPVQDEAEDERGKGDG